MSHSRIEGLGCRDFTLVDGKSRVVLRQLHVNLITRLFTIVIVSLFEESV